MSAPVTTEDLGLAAFLYANGHKILSVSLILNTQNLKRFGFPAGAAEDVASYFSGAPSQPGRTSRRCGTARRS